MADGIIRLYDAEKNLLHDLATGEPIAAIRFGPFAREDGALAVISTTGAGVKTPVPDRCSGGRDLARARVCVCVMGCMRICTREVGIDSVLLYGLDQSGVETAPV